MQGRQEFAIKSGGQPSRPLQGEKPPHFGRGLLMRPAPCSACWWPTLPGILSSNLRFMHTHAPLCARGTNALPSSWFCLQSTNSFCSAHAQACLGTHGACIFCNSHTLHVQHFFFCTKISQICRGPDMNFYIQSSLGEKCVKCNSWG